MKTRPGACALIVVFVAAGGAASGQQESSIHLVVTAEAHHGAEPPRVTREDVTVLVNKNRRPTTAWTPVDTAGVQLWLLMDDGADSSIGSQFSDIRKFIDGLPASVEIGLGYMRNGGVTVAHSLSSDHEAVAKALRLPMGVPGVSASPYLSLVDLVKKWPPSERAREALMITSGIDFVYGPGPQNPYLQHAIDEAQRAGVVVSSVYFGSTGHAGHSYWQITWGQNDLSQLADATGGEFYWQGMTNPVSFSPYLEQAAHRMNEQFLITFDASPQGKAGFEPVDVRTEIPHVSLVTQKRVWVGAAH